MDELRRKLDQLGGGNAPADPSALIQELLTTDLPRFTQNLQAGQRNLKATPPAEGATPSAPVQRPSPAVHDILAGLQRYTTIPVPILAIFRATPDWVEGRLAAAALEKGVPSAHVVQLPDASHEVLRSNEADVLREMDAFISGLPQ